MATLDSFGVRTEAAPSWIGAMNLVCVRKDSGSIIIEHGAVANSWSSGNRDWGADSELFKVRKTLSFHSFVTGFIADGAGSQLVSGMSQQAGFGTVDGALVVARKSAPDSYS